MQDQFSFKQFRVSDDRREVFFDYELGHNSQTYGLTESLRFPVPLLDTPAQQRSLRALHIALGISYYKIFLPASMAHPYAMDEPEADFWNDVWQHGLGEFLYVNKVSSDRLARFSQQDGQTFEPPAADAQASGALLGIGGGKDSIVAGELLKALDVPFDGFVMATGEQLGQTGQVAETMQVPLHAVGRQLDKQLLELQTEPGAMQGHVPISLIFGLVGTALAVALAKRYVVVANEASASMPQVDWNDVAVNHQWSKSFGFERSLQASIQKYIAPQVCYFSAIRQLTSVGVAKIFSNYPAYFEVFTSDNFVFRIDPAKRPAGRWSLESPKSLSSYILLAPWLDNESVQRIFGLDFLNQASLKPLFLSLMGVEGEPPLDCVGTVPELVLSLNLLAQADRYGNTVLMQLAKENCVIVQKDWQAELAAMLELQPEQALPSELQDGVLQFLQARLAQ
ncbi:MAG TPA: hypothetical protein VLF87_00780 [Patescibacteria group bacterium]|nr:hypothetical protein [Patescibacteria group bacterium]